MNGEAAATPPFSGMDREVFACVIKALGGDRRTRTRLGAVGTFEGTGTCRARPEASVLRL
jgi:hypothetical protein